MILQRPRLLGDMDEDESAGVDVPEEEHNGVLEDHNGKVTSIVIANLTGELPPHFSHPGSQTIYVTNTGQILTGSVADSELEERQHEALNVLLEQLQPTGAYQDGNEVQFGPETANYYTNSELDGTDKSEVPQTINSECNAPKSKTEGNASILQEEDTNLVLSDTHVTSQYEPMREEGTGPDGILTDYKPETVRASARSCQQNNRENVMNIISTRVTIIHDSNSEGQSESARVGVARNAVDEPDVHSTSIFEEFQTNVVPEEMRPKPRSENICTSVGQGYHTGEVASVVLRAGSADLISSNDGHCVMNPVDLETVASSSDLRLPVGQDDVSSAFLDLHSEPHFDTTDAQNLDKSAGSAKVQDDVSLAASFDLSAVSEGACFPPAESAKTVDLGPPYNCDICNKEFHKADYLYRHLRKHTGEFTCVSCLAVFARKESLTNHSCFTDASGVNKDAPSLVCPYCQKKFLVKKIFKRHMAKHTGKFAVSCLMPLSLF
jgi:hypothetical protein